MPLYKLVILPILVPHRQYKRCRRGKKNVVICFVGAFLVNVVISEGTDEVGFGCYDAVVLEMVEDQRLAAGSDALVGDMVILYGINGYSQGEAIGCPYKMGFRQLILEVL